MLATETEKRTEKIGKQTQFLRGAGEERERGWRTWKGEWKVDDGR